MKQKSLILIIIFFFLQNCGYAPIYSKTNNIIYKFTILELQGDNEMNNSFSSHIKKYTNNDSNKLFKLKVQTNYIKNILTKNKKGEATSYSIKKTIEFEIINYNNKKFIFEEEIKSASMDNQFELKKYENTIKRNFIQSKTDEFILNLSDIK